MKRIAFCLALLLIAGLTVTAFAATAEYTFDGPRARLTLDTSVYDMILTPQTLEKYEKWLTDHGMTLEDTANRFEDDGVLVEAYDSANGRVLVVTALADVNARELFDVNALEDSERKYYRQSHSNGTFYGLQGYTYNTAQWKNYGSNLGRFLRLKYTLSISGETVHRGYQRRTVRNGYTITFDMQVKGRAPKDADEKALDRAVNSFAFLEILNSPVGACKLTLTTQPEREVTTDTVTIAGKTEAGGSLTATVISLTDSKTSTQSATADGKGKFKMSVKFPQQGTYSINLLAVSPDGRSSQKAMTVMYQRDYIPVNLSTAIPSSISANSLTVSGTTVAGVKVQISVSGPKTMQKSVTRKSFSFTVDTREEGTYTILLTVTKKGMSPRTLSFTTVRSISDAERLERVKKNAEQVKYSTLRKSISKYAGKVLNLSGYVQEVRSAGSEYVVRLAVNRSGSTYKDFIYVICKEDPALTMNQHVRVYGTLSENPYIEVVEGGGSSEYPRLELLAFEELD